MQASGARQDRPPANRVAPAAGWLRYLRRVYTEPFSADPQEAELPLPVRERRRRAALLRLIVLTLTALQVVLTPGSLANHPPPIVTVTQLLVLLLGVLCLALNASGRTITAGIVYVYGVCGIAINVTLRNPGGFDARALLIYGLLAAFILLSGLLLPRWAIWLTMFLAIVASVVGLVGLPIALGGVSGMPSAEGIRLLVGGLLVASYAITAILTWVFARSAQAGLVASARAFAHERELAALKDQFIVDANHELRTPIMALQGNVALLLELGERATPEQRKRLLERAQRSGEVVLHQLNNVLDAGAVGAGVPPLAIRPVQLAPLVLTVLETFDPREIGEPGLERQAGGQRSVRVLIPPSLSVLADEMRLRQVLVNLLTNALKYSPPSSPLEVVATLTAAPPAPRAGRPETPAASSALAAGVQISVRDHGLGVPPGEATKLFHRFVRLERDIAGSVRGTGVGLYLCREFVEAMGGRIWVESSGVPGEGSLFAFTLPVAPAPLGSEDVLPRTSVVAERLTR